MSLPVVATARPAARIYRPAKNAMQSGKARTKSWVLEFEPGAARVPEPLMGWVSGADTQAQVKLTFASKEEAVAYAQRNGLAATITEPQAPSLKIRSYADNFRPGRIRW
ncbi:NADH-ubiquinone oxidoreductase [Elstera cyanobacteriorum]|uniref:ETC complex I subunit n=1 Tax=Elstera cyanobacteriorum TaxID=2022747 RepID=A0A255XQF4_9PROT|nr:ETC complex I subunit [Elstera cyanobacteriorum]OYQ18675.1 ETC complex I subunit [Elstera cyanobacteriorum]GFZ78499.1 NADH-ubiquinone oxidoreductase [Elstera cyanobacteriorum]